MGLTKLVLSAYSLSLIGLISVASRPVCADNSEGLPNGSAARVKTVVKPTRASSSSANSSASTSTAPSTPAVSSTPPSASSSSAVAVSTPSTAASSSSAGGTVAAPGGPSSPADASASAVGSSVVAPHPVNPNSVLNGGNKAGILSQSQQQHEPGLVARALGGLVSDAAHATMALVGTTIMNQGVDLPPDDASSPQWPFNEPHRKALFYVDWADGTTAKISRLPDGSLQILGGGHRYTMQPEGEGSFALFGDYGSMATVTPRPGGGFTICKADGTVEQVLPRAGGGFTVNGANGVIATILPGVNGKKHVIRGRSFSSGFIQ